MKDYYSFIYLDEQMVEILYSQIFDNIVEENVSSSSAEQIKSNVKANLINVLNSSIDGQETTSSFQSTRSVNSIYKKAQILVNYFRDNSIIELEKIITKNRNFDENIYFVGKSTFFLSEVYDKKTGLSLFDSPSSNEYYFPIDENSIFILETGNTDFLKKHCSKYINTDDYFSININKYTDYGIIMHMSNNKMKKDIRHLTTKIKRAKHFNFFVFGELIKESSQYYKISPYAIWQF